MAQLLSEIAFPVVETGGRVALHVVQVERMPTLDHKERHVVGHSRPEMADIIHDARAGDPMAGRLDGVSVRFLPSNFTGASYGLALALADKRVRFPERSARAKVIATGEILRGARGRIGPIAGFDAKAEMMARAAKAADEPVVLAFSAENWASASTSARSTLEQAARTFHVSLRPAESLGDLADLWTDPPPHRRGALRAGGLATLAAAAIGMAAVLVVNRWPVFRCESAIRQLDLRRDQQRAATAVDRCSAAARERPRDGHTHFLAGQAYAVVRATDLARFEWRTAATLGDPNGLATWGRALWLSDPHDPSTVGRALGYLKQAASAGSFTAAEDVGSIYLDARQVELASRWFRTARALRARRTGGE